MLAHTFEIIPTKGAYGTHPPYTLPFFPTNNFSTMNEKSSTSFPALNFKLGHRAVSQELQQRIAISFGVIFFFRPPVYMIQVKHNSHELQSYNLTQICFHRLLRL